VPQPLIYEQLKEWGIDISTGQVNRLLNEEHQIFEQEQQQVLKVGLETAGYIHFIKNYTYLLVQNMCGGHCPPYDYDY
jgi:hypothetical protein